jgi:hypothetical protein
MKRFIVFLLTISVVFFMGGCNTPSDDIDDGLGPGEEIILTDGGWYALASPNQGDKFPGATIDLEQKLGKTFEDISKYASVTVNAILYTTEKDASPAEIAVQSDPSKNLAQFKLLKENNNWGTESNICGGANGTKYSMNVNGDSIWSVPDSATGVPKFLLLQANWTPENEENGIPSASQIKSIKVNSITFAPRIADFTLEHIFGSSLTLSGGTKLIFNNAAYSDNASGSNWVGGNGVGHAALLVFPAKYNATEKNSLQNKTIKINFTIEAHECPNTTPPKDNVEHQLNVQAASNKDKTMFNGQNPDPANNKPGQKYVTLDSTNETGYDNNTRTGTISIPANDFIAASDYNGTSSDNDAKGPFVLDAVRLVNNGTSWDDGTITHYRCKTYNLIINSVVIE